MHPIVPIVGLSALQALASGSSGVSREAHAIYEAATEVAASVERSQALFGEKASALATLATLEAEYAKPGWDGEGAEAISPIAAARAKCFVRAMPDGIPLPEFAPEPDGSISLDWVRSPTRLFSLSVGRGDRLAYAWLDGSDKGHAVARFDGQSIPHRVLEGIQDIVGRHATLRAT
jgi:hypothetical protein